IAGSKNWGCEAFNLYMDAFCGGKITISGIIGRPWVRKIQEVPSTAHMMLKFLVPIGILTLQSSSIIPLECTMVSGPEAQPFDVIQVAEERIKWRNLDIFAWKPEDMKGVLRHLAEHHLNVREGCIPIRQ
ncbi:hypothetical protein Tco_0274376, partial [Tanacetum coccineum]